MTVDAGLAVLCHCFVFAGCRGALFFRRPVREIVADTTLCRIVGDHPSQLPHSHRFAVRFIFFRRVNCAQQMTPDFPGSFNLPDHFREKGFWDMTVGTLDL